MEKFLRFCLLPVLLLNLTPAQAATTYEGTEGMAAQVFNAGTYASFGSSCIACHSGATADYYRGDGGYPNFPDLDTWTAVNGYSSNASGTCAASGKPCMVERINEGEMPQGDPLNATGMALATAWASSGYPRWASPDVTTRTESGVSKYGVTLRGYVKENGSETSVRFRYRIGTGTYTYVSATSPTGTGGDDTNKSVTYALSGLTCGTTYNYQFQADNSVSGSYVSGATEYFTTSACPSITTGTSTTQNISEDESPTPFSSFTLNASESVTWSISTPASNGTATRSPSTGTSTLIDYSPDANYNGSDSFVVRATDGTTSDYYTVNINISAQNDAPVITQGTSVTVNMSEDSSPTPFSRTLNATDVEGDTLTWSILTPASNGTATASGTGTSKAIGYTPDLNYNGSDSFVVQVSDGSLSDTITVNVNISAQNDAPVITEGTSVLVNMSEDSSPTPFSRTLNATDVEGNTLTWSISTPASNGTASATGTGSSKAIGYTPDLNYNGSDSFVVQVSDGSLSDTITVNVSIAAINDPPVISSSPSTSATEDVQYSYTVTVTDPDDSGFGTNLTLALNTAEDNNGSPLAGVSFNTSTGLLTYTPTNGIASPLSFEVQVEDGDEDGSGPTVQSWSVNVNGVNDPPSITSTAPTTATEDTLYTYTATVSDIDDDNNGTDLTWSLTNEPSGMTVSTTGVVTWTPLEGVTTSGVVTLSVADGGENGALPATEDFTVSVTAVNDPPVITAVPSANAVEETLYQFDVLVSDPDDSSWTFALSGEPAGMSINPSSGRISWTPAEGVLASGTVTVTAADSGADGALPDSDTFSISVTPVNDQPSITSSPVLSATEDTLYQYQLTVSDADIPADSHSYDLTVAPAGMLVSSGGLVQWTPTEAGPSQTTPYNVSVTARVRDGLEDGVTPVLQPYTISVTPVNDAPVITDESLQQVEELSAFSLALTVTDPDDLNNGTDLVWSGITLPGTMSLSSTGTLDWTPPEDSSGATGVAFTDYTVTVQVADGGEDSAVPDQMTFTLRVTKLDADADLVADYNDNCPNGALDPADADDDPDQTDTNLDGEGDLCDPDDDGDGIEDVAEVANGLDPKDPSDAALDLDGDGLSNLDEFNACVGTADYPDCANIGVDSVAPTISLVSPLVVPSTGYLTVVTPGVTANDGNEGGTAVTLVELDGEVVSVAAGSSFSLRPGRHSFVWESSDSELNTAQRTQVIDVLPRLSLTSSQTLGEGQSGDLVFTLNGDAPSYPVSIYVSRSGTASDTDIGALSGSVTIASGREATTVINVIDDGPGEGDEEMVFSVIGHSANMVLSDANTHRLLIVERQVAPEVRLAVSQNGRSGNRLYVGEGTVEVAATARDANGDMLSYSWSASPAITFTGTDTLQTFDPAALSGLYTLTLEVSDGVDTTTQQVAVLVDTGTPPVLSAMSDQDGDGIDDATEGDGDTDGDGIPDYLDALEEAFSLQLSASVDGIDQNSLLHTEGGLSLRVGSGVLLNGGNGARVYTGTMMRDPSYSIIGAAYDFEIHGLNEAQRSAHVVIPLLQAIPPAAVYRKLNAAGDAWSTFIEDGNNAIASAARVNGECPAISSASWQAGLQTGVSCVRLLMNDGGPNDADGAVNGVIRDPGGVAVARALEDDDSVPSKSVNEGAGSVGWWWLTPLLAIGARRRRGKNGLSA